MPDTTTSADLHGNAPLSADEIRALIQKIEQSGALGRSKVYIELLRYLGEATISGSVPKEITIAVDVLGKGADFDVSTDSLVRVYIHKLRQKLDAYYDNQGAKEHYQILIPKGQYSLQFIASDERQGSQQKNQSSDKPGNGNEGTKRFGVQGLLAAAVVLLIVNLAYQINHSQESENSFSNTARLDGSALWTPIIDDDRPVLLVIGDYYIFAEDRGPDQPGRLIREYDINSPKDLGRLIRRQIADGKPSNYYNVNLTYIPRSSAFALQNLLPALTLAGKEISIQMSSQITGADLRSQHVIYLGYISAMRELEEFAFAASNFAVGYSYDELIQIDSGDIYRSEEISSVEHSDTFNDLGILSSFPMLDGHQMMIVAGTRDTGLMHMAQLISSTESLNSIDQWLGSQTEAMQPSAFEALYRVAGLEGVNFDAEQVYIGTLNHEQIWRTKAPEAADNN